MNLFSCAYIAFKNFICKKKTMIKIISAYTIIAFSVICFFSYQKSVFSQMNHIISKSISDCYVETDNPLQKTDYPSIEEEKVFRGFYDYNISIENVSLILDGTEYKGTDDFSYYFEFGYSPATPKFPYSVPFKIDAYDSGGVIFSEFDKSEFYNIAPDESLVLAGDLNIDKNKIIISDYLLERFGVSYEEALGGTVTLKNSETGEIYCGDLTLSGIVNSNVFYTSANQSRAQFIISIDNSTDDFDEPIYRYYCSDWESTLNLAQQTKSGYNLTLELYSSAEIQKTIIDDVLTIIIAVLLTALIIWILTALYFYYRQQKTYRNILWSLGMKNQNSFLIAFFELLYCLIISSVLALALSIAFISLFNLYCENLDIYISLDFANIAALSLISAFSLLIFSAIVSAVGSALAERNR